MKVLPGLVVFLALEICMISIVFSRGILPQQEMQELDIFMEEEGHNQISRSKRTDSQADMEGESSGEIPESSSPDGQGLVMPREDTDAQNKTVDTTLPESQDNEDELLQPPGDPETNATDPNFGPDATNPPNFETEATNPPATDTSLKIDVEVTYRNTAKYISSTQSHENVQESTTIPVTTPSPGPPIADGSQQNSTSGRIETTGQPIPDYAPDVNIGNSESPLGSRSGAQPIPDGTEIPPISLDTDARGVSINMTVTANVDEGPKQENAPVDPKVFDVPEITTAVPNLGASGKSNASDSDQLPRIPETPQVNTNQTVAVNRPDDKVSSNSTTSAPVKNVTKSETTTSEPNAGASGKSSVSGSGVLFTIVILVVVAGLAGLGYYMYKKRKSGYDPVAVEDRDREMGTMKAENGIGKPLSEDEIKSADQLTPIHPQAAQRTFGGAPPDEKILENVEVIKEDGEQEERDRREPSVEYKETDAKKEKDEGEGEGEGEDERKK